MVGSSNFNPQNLAQMALKYAVTAIPFIASGAAEIRIQNQRFHIQLFETWKWSNGLENLVNYKRQVLILGLKSVLVTAGLRLWGRPGPQNRYKLSRYDNILQNYNANTIRWIIDSFYIWSGWMDVLQLSGRRAHPPAIHCVICVHYGQVWISMDMSWKLGF